METYTDKTKEEIIAILRDIVVAIDAGVITDLRSVVSKVEETIGQKFEAGNWCPPSCNPEMTADEDQRSVVS